MLAPSSHAADYVPTRKDADTALEAFLKEFASMSTDKIVLDKKPYNRSRSFWTDAEILEILIDYYEQTGQKKYLLYIRNFFKGYELTHGRYNTTWQNNDYNDDLMWITIACARIYLLTGEEYYKEAATYTFDKTFARAWTPAYGGGLLWKRGETTKNSCIEYPATIAALLLYKIHGDEKTIPFTDYSKGEPGVTSQKNYLEIATEIYNWAYTRLRDSDLNSSTYGKIFDSYNNDRVTNAWDGTYNYGTFVGSAVLLYQLTGQEKYLRDAYVSANFSMKRKYEKRVIDDEYNGNDLPGFKGILARWYGYFIREIDSDKYKTVELRDWLWKNASTAWNNRNDKNIIWTRWNTKTSDDMTNVRVDNDYNYYSSWGCAAALSLLINIPEYVEPTETDTLTSADGKSKITTVGKIITADAVLKVNETYTGLDEAGKTELKNKFSSQYAGKEITVFASYNISVRKDNSNVDLGESVKYELTLPEGFTLSGNLSYDVWSVNNGKLGAKASTVNIGGDQVTFTAAPASTFVLVGFEYEVPETTTEETTTEPVETEEPTTEAPETTTDEKPEEGEGLDVKKIIIAAGVAVLGIAAIATAVLVAVKASKKRA